MGINVEDSGWEGVRQGPTGSQGLSGPRPSGGRRGHLRLRQAQILSSSSDLVMCNQKWELLSLDIKNAFLLADGYTRDVFLQAPEEWGPSRSEGARKLKAPAYGLHDAPVAFHRSLKQYLLNSEASMQNVGLRCQASSFAMSGLRCQVSSFYLS